MKYIKKITAFLLTFVLILSIVPLSVFAASSQTVKMGYIFESGVNIRKDASTSSSKVSTVSNWNVKITGNKNDINGTINSATNKPYIWYKVSYVSQSKTIAGYVREDLIKVKEYTVSNSFKNSLSAFPESYHDDLILLHAMYPNWKFVADKVPMTFTEAVALEDKGFTKLVETKYNSWRSMREGCFDWSKNKFITTDGGRYGASTEVIKYYMDPRNFLNANDIYMYLKQTYDADTQTLDGVKEILDGTFLDAKIKDKKDKYYDKSYGYVIRKAAEQSKVNAYVLASTLVQEHGVNGTTLSNGTAEYKDKKVYNFFNFGASGSTKEDIVKNGSKYAYNEGWFTPTESIIGGAEKYASGYISNGQDTYFYKNYNILQPDKLWHQYAQNVADSLSSAKRLRTTYAELNKLTLTFRIPVYESISDSTYKLPAQDQDYNNYYFTKLKAEGLTPSFDKYNQKYTLNITKDTTLFYELPSGAKFEGQASYQLKAGTNTVKLKVRSQTGYSEVYTITVNAKKTATLIMQQSGGYLEKAADGNLYYYIDGERNYASNIIVKYQNKWYYIWNGVWAPNVTTFVKYADKWHYIKDGIKLEKSALVPHNGQMHFIRDGVKSSETLFVKSGNNWQYVKKGIASKETTLVKHNGKYRYIKNGILSKATTLVKYKGKWHYVVKGVKSYKTGLIKYKGTMRYIKDGVRKNSTTLVKYKGKMRYVKKGYLSKSTALVKYKGKQYYVKKGVWTKNTLIYKYNGKRYYVKSGKVASTYNGWVRVKGRSYRIRKGKVI